MPTPIPQNAPLNWDIHNQPHGLFVTCYRPIVIRVKVTGTQQPAHIVGTLLLESNTQNGNFEDTGVKVNGYTEDNDGFYSFNVAEVCKSYFNLDEDNFHNEPWCSTFYRILGRAFKVRINPVNFLSNGGVEVDEDDELVTWPFIVVPLITKHNEQTSTVEYDNVRVDKWVNNGDNDSEAAWFDASWNENTSNMPQNNEIDIAKGFYYFQSLLLRGVSGRNNYFTITNNTTGVSMDFDTGNSQTARHHYNTIHPVAIEFLLFIETGTNQNLLLDSNGDLTTDSMTIQLKYKNSTTYATERYSKPMTYKLYDSRKSGTGTCRNKMFVFRNMRGGIDWFIAKGQQDQEINISGKEFQSHIDYDRGSAPAHGQVRGKHSVKSLQNARKEIYKVFTQPVNKEYAVWLQELVSSPQVWICEEIEDFNREGAVGLESFLWTQGGEKLKAINIIKSSYKIHTTEKRINYLEFKYTLSENSLVQKF